ncbi:MAG: hypothetical protein Q7R81_03895 [Candidatus Peregrinibacteria bacterium]|nr:hypothetical protein [Candidatus Peregrinibacteria bacterium]
MHFLALQTDVNLIKKQFIAEGEKELTLATYHFLVFFLPFLGSGLATVLVLAGVFYSLSIDLLGFLPATIFLLIFLFLYGNFLFSMFVKWKYNYIVVTTQKVVVIDHVSFFHQNINPIHLNNITSVVSGTQFMNLFTCGELTVNLKSSEGDIYRELKRRYVHNAQGVAAVIENSLVLSSQGTLEKKEPEKSNKEIVEEVREKGEKVV